MEETKNNVEIVCFKLEIINKCPIIYDGDNIILIDTGAPITIHKGSILTFMK